MTKPKLLKCFAVALAISIILFSAAFEINPYNIFGLDVESHNLISTSPEETYHVIGYGVDAKHAEEAYLYVRGIFGAEYVNNKVKIYSATPKWEDGAIGATWDNRRYIGVYRQSLTGRPDVIIYNGDDLTLLHELGHFFFHHMTSYHRDEAFARMTAGIIQADQQYRIILQLLHAFQAGHRGETNSNVESV